MSYITKSEMTEHLNQRLLPLETALQQVKGAADFSEEKFQTLDAKVSSRDAEFENLERRLEELNMKLKDLEKVSSGFRSSE